MSYSDARCLRAAPVVAAVYDDWNVAALKRIPTPGAIIGWKDRVDYFDPQCEFCVRGMVRGPGVSRICECALEKFYELNSERLKYDSYGNPRWAEGADLLH